MGRLIFDLNDDERSTLEAIRQRLGCRSHAETLRRLIQSSAHVDDRRVAVRTTDAGMKRAKAILAATGQSLGDISVGPQRAAPGSRLKGKK